ncbi:hypothetical protein H1Z61_05810 [Bacillus aquiflavi]|uniref:Uncharacterized protein n=1 Tax=Bacillus aquiflavi TaxID=2672567 RepID=A0A6B3VSU1_9BACI|nr:hypothetical protein [Bacillus aquiflavi]MBA4536671.1 hypothetical protein [Bacillus aquiflavi]NEY81039.1 hypothetical protein [Bacillus aquiflavi]UAC47890.1 hypothetical protein K6959_15000 [Bacillus aquiflavi]
MVNALERAERLEIILESLIKILGKTNERVDTLSKRVIQMEYSLQDASRQTKRVCLTRQRYDMNMSQELI